jgi:glutathione-regulated potassium-efflux system ancillary protein KefF
MAALPNIVIYFAHLAVEQSAINSALCAAVRDLPQVDFRDLHELYPDFFIDVAHEQTVLQNADLIVFQHPVYWYAAPAIFKHFQDNVLVQGFAYGTQGTALQGKDFLLVASTGASVTEYRPGGIHQYTFEQFMYPIMQTVRFCGMHYLQPLLLHGGQDLSQAVIEAHAARYRRMLESYRPERNSG